MKHPLSEAATELRDAINGGECPTNVEIWGPDASKRPEYELWLSAQSLGILMLHDQLDLRDFGQIRSIWSTLLLHRDRPEVRPWLEKYVRAYVEHFNALKEKNRKNF